MSQVVSSARSLLPTEALCHKHLKECSKECCNEYFFVSTRTDFGKLYTTLSQQFIHPHDRAVYLYQRAKSVIVEMRRSNEQSFWWKFTAQAAKAQPEQVPHVTHLIEQALQLVTHDPLPWLQKRLLLLMADMTSLNTLERDKCLYYVQKACGLEYWYQYQIYRSCPENNCPVSELGDFLQLKLQISKEDTTCAASPLLESLPKEWTIVGLTPSDHGMYLWLRPGSCCQVAQNPILIQYSLPSLENGKTILQVVSSRLESLIQASHDQAAKFSANPSMEDKSLWWKERKQLDEQFSTYMQDLEDSLLGAWKVFLLSSTNAQDEDTDNAFYQLQAISGKQWKLDKELFYIIFSRRIFLDRKEDWLYLLSYAIDYHHRSPSQQTKLWKKLQAYVDVWWCNNQEESRNSSSSLLQVNSSILLVLDDTLLPFPIESIPFLTKWRQGITRTSNLQLSKSLFLQQQKQTLKYNQSDTCSYFVSTKSAFFVLNPSGDLSRTQQTFQSLFQHQYGWDGLVGPLHLSKSESKELVEKLAQYQLFVYCGHGTGEKFFPAKHVRKLEQAPVTLLMGCRSGKPTSQGIYSPNVSCFSFLYAHAPAVVVNLWDVTDKDIDRFTQHLFQEWIQGEDCLVDLSLAIARARDKCYFTHLTGCAPVVYGLPWIRTWK